MNAPEAGPAEAQPRSEPWPGLRRLASLPIWARLIMLTAAGLISLIGSSLFLSSALHQTADRTTKMKALFDVVGAA